MGAQQVACIYWKTPLENEFKKKRFWLESTNKTIYFKNKKFASKFWQININFYLLGDWSREIYLTLLFSIVSLSSSKYKNCYCCAPLCQGFMPSLCLFSPGDFVSLKTNVNLKCPIKLAIWSTRICNDIYLVLYTK